MTQPKHSPSRHSLSARKARIGAAIGRASRGKARVRSKQDQVLALLKKSQGCTIATIMRATGWKAHSVRGFLAGVVRKKLGLVLESSKTDVGRVYRVVTRIPKPRLGQAAPSVRAGVPKAPTGPLRKQANKL